MENIETVNGEIVQEEEKDTMAGGYSKGEHSIINNIREARNNLINNIMSTTPRGKELEGLITLLNDQESSAHKTASTRLKIKEEDNNSKLNAGIIAVLAQERDRKRQDAVRNGISNDTTRLSIPKEYEPEDIVLGEMSQIDKKEQLDVNDFMAEGEL